MRKNNKLNPAGIALIIVSLLICVIQPLGDGTIQQYAANAACLFGGIPCGLAITDIIKRFGDAWTNNEKES